MALYGSDDDYDYEFPTINLRDEKHTFGEQVCYDPESLKDRYSSFSAQDLNNQIKEKQAEIEYENRQIEINQAYKEGYANGMSTGKEQGYQAGYSTGYGKGYNTGYDQGEEEGYCTGYLHGRLS